ncbi:MAG: DUF2066 domain-containing protein [Steroidobacteraceae bacterium]
MALNANHGMYTRALPNFLKNTRMNAAAAVCWAWLACLLLMVYGVAQAAAVNGLYDATVRVKDRAEATRTAAYATALGIVLTKVSGRSDAATRVGAGLNGAARYVQRYSYLANGQLEVGFEPKSINVLLEQAGLPLWERERPNTLVVYPQALQGLREASMATEQTAKLRGVPIVWANGETSEQFSATSTQQLQELARRYDASAVLLARVNPSAVTAASLRWQMVFNGGTQEMAGSAEEGPNLAADVLGRYYASAGKETTRLVLEVAGMDNLDAYANTLSYVGNLLMVRNVAVESLQRDVLRVQLDVRGSQESLRRALAIDQRLIEVPSPVIDATAQPGGSANTLIYRYRSQ